MTMRSKIITAYTIRVIYKSGATIDFNVKDFTFKNGSAGPQYAWTTLDGSQTSPIQFGADDVAAVWRIAVFDAEVEDNDEV